MKKLWRIYLFGGPNEGKTTCLLDTFPRPIAIINAPGENGHDTVAARLAPDVYMPAPFDPYAKPESVIRDVEKLWLETVKSGKYQTIAFEGLHKLMDHVMDDVTGGAYLKGDEFDGRRAFVMGYRQMDQLLNRFLNNTTPVVVLTGWDKAKSDNFTDPKAEKYRQPALIGQYAEQIKGQVANVFHHSLKRMEVDGKKVMVPRWQTKPTPLVRGVGMKGAPKDFPADIPADFRVLLAEWQKFYPIKESAS